MKSDILFSHPDLEGLFTIFALETPFYETLMLSIDYDLVFVDLGTATIIYKQFAEKYLDWIKESLPMQYHSIQERLQGKKNEVEGGEILYRSYPFGITKEEGWYRIRMEDYKAEDHYTLYFWFIGLIQKLEEIWQGEIQNHE